MSSNLKLPELMHPFEIRPNSTDLAIFGQVFLNRSYHFDLKAEPKLIIDGGANIGLASIFFASKFPNAKIIAVEPEEKNFKAMLRNTANYKNIICMQGALWPTKTKLSLFDDGRGESGYVTKEGAQNQIIESYPIHDLAKERIIDVLKIDIEGSELELFASNYQRWLPKVKCLIIETHDSIRKGSSLSVLKAISNYDFSLSVRGENLIFINNLL